MPDPARVTTAVFLPGQELRSGASRSSGVLERVCALEPAEVDAALVDLRERFAHRHADLERIWLASFALVEHRLPRSRVSDEQRRLLIGATFTQEVSLEGAALCNPSIVAHPDQGGLPPGSLRLVLSLRAVGEGHRSSIELRTATIDAADDLVIDPVEGAPVRALTRHGPYERTAFEHHLADVGGARASADFVLSQLGLTFSRADLDAALVRLRRQLLTRGESVREIAILEDVAARCYTSSFAAASTLDQRVLVAEHDFERQGLEDLRLTPLRTLAGERTFAGTYTAFDGRSARGQLLRTKDFRTFSSAPLVGPGARDKGLALFPRPIGGRYAALSRADRETNSLTWSTDLIHWTEPIALQHPGRRWDLVQLGNCGSPLETERGWLVLTHGVGPMRTYGIGALLLDRDDPTRVLGSLPYPLLTPAASERSGYVPNVVYSCGSLLHGRTLVLPYGCSDTSTRIATVDLDSLLDALAGHPSPIGGETR
ncbi:glycoside hydrolase [Serinibacter arcticus]|uniref:Glycoside hydrolase n=1 Tax=Serinibacter arcticus TaxID=1655435 RepID=A0A4Z1E0R8_9MICO|nr:glycoside hydrolase [Serinibacter arcticus]